MICSALSDSEYSEHGRLSLARRLTSYRLSELDLSTTKELEHFPIRRGVSTLDLEVNEGRYLLSGSVCGTIIIHDVQEQPKKHQTCPSRCKIRPSSQKRCSVSKLQWYPHDTGIFTSSGSDGILKIWDTNCLTVVEQFKFKSIVNTHSLGRTSAHCLIAAGNSSDPYVTLCDMKSGSATHILRGHRKSILSIDWSPTSDHFVISGSEDNQILLWDIRRASGPLTTFDQYNGANMGSSSNVFTAHHGHVTGVRYTSDGLFIVSSGSDNKLKLWNAVTGKNTMVNYGKVKSIAPGSSCQFGLSSFHGGADPVISIGLGSDVVLYDAESGTKLKVLKGHYGTVHSCIFHPFHLELYSGSGDSNILIWTPKIKKVSISKRRNQNRITGMGISVNQDEWSSDED